MVLGMLSALAVAGICAAVVARPVLSLWPKGNPGGWTTPEAELLEVKEDGISLLRHVHEPTLELYLAKDAPKDAPMVIVAPGGGYWLLAISHEGHDIAAMLAENGIHAAVLKYRLPVPDRDLPKWKVPLEDAQRAVRVLRAAAGKHGFNPDRVGMMGFSAGGHLTAMASNVSEDTYGAVDEADKLSPRPAFSVLIYSAYINGEASQELKTDVAVSSSTPPAFVVHTLDDGIPVESSISYILACKAAGVPVEAHIFPKGGHGYGLRSKEPGLRDWPKLLVAWLKSLWSDGSGDGS